MLASRSNTLTERQKLKEYLDQHPDLQEWHTSEPSTSSSIRVEDPKSYISIAPTSPTTVIVSDHSSVLSDAITSLSSTVTSLDSLSPFIGNGQLRRMASDGGSDVGVEDEEDAESSPPPVLEVEEFETEEELYKVRPPSVRSNTSVRSSAFGIHISDVSERETCSFATKVTIPRFFFVGKQNADGYVVYECIIITKDNISFRTMKRYSSFVVLKEALKIAFPYLRNIMPKLPPKTVVAKYNTSFLEKRRKGLAFWLANVLLHPETGGSGIARSWILE
ncbi:Phox-like protein [Atractiella rhizophila]|nr:Phox-like protein [Atractiella rhizophila]